MRPQAGEAGIRTGLDRGHGRGNVLGMDAAPTEARLDLDVDREAAALAAGGGLGRRRGTDSGRDRGVSEPSGW